jgi:RNA polymerase sigma-70 factor (ECF subfamily)
LDIKITDRLLQGDENAFKELVEEYRQMVFRTCMGVLHDPEDADDVTQEVFIEVFRSVGKFRADARISTWLYRIALNKSLNFIRDNRKHRALSLSGAPQSDALTGQGTDGPEEILQNKEKKMILERAIDSLPTKQKKAFVLNKYDDLSYKEISEVMKLSVSSVESLLFRAKQNLQKKLLDCYQKSC